MKAIIYRSNTGHTEEYAKLLSKKLNIPHYNLASVPTELKKEEVIYLGWICATKISGLTKAMTEYHVVCVGGVGVTNETEKYIKSLIEKNNIKVPFFYLRGGINYDKLKGMKKVLLKMVGKTVKKANKEEDKEIIKVFEQGGSFVSEKELEKIVKFSKEKRKS